MEAMPEYEENVRAVFGNRQIKIFPSEREIGALHKAIEAYTGEKYKPAPKSLIRKIEDVLKLHDVGAEFDTATMQRHLYFFHQKNFSRSHISSTLKKLSKRGTLENVARGVYRKA